MNIGLFDLYTTGHHLPYASGVKQALEAVSDHDVSFITLSKTDRCTEFFDPAEIAYVDAPESPPIEERSGSFGAVSDAKIEEFCSTHQRWEYDVIHFLYADDILGPLWRHCPQTEETRFIGELNGVFFHRGTVLRRPYLHQTFLKALGSPAGRMIDRAVPEQTSHEALWADLYLYRCLRDRTLDRMVVHSREAGEYVSVVDPGGGTPIEKIPYPAPEQFGHDVSKSEARHRLDLPAEDRILLFFGSMKREKGIDFLLDALRRYRGPEFTMLLAGPPTAVSEREVEAIARRSNVNITYEFGFVDTPELYYRAADATILPYRRQYGRERASQMFEEVCSALCPVIVPGHGVLGRLTEEWQLGTTYEQESHEALVATLETFARDGIAFSREQMRDYNAHHTYEQVARTLCELYGDRGPIEKRHTDRRSET